MGLLYGRAGRLSTKNAGFRPAQGGDEATGLPEFPLGCEHLGGNEWDVLLAIRWVHGMSVICTECGLKTPWFVAGGDSDPKSECWLTTSDPWSTTRYMWQQVFNKCKLWCLPATGPDACVYNWTSDKPCCDHCGDHPVSTICLNDTRGHGSRGRGGITTPVSSYTLL